MTDPARTIRVARRGDAAAIATIHVRGWQAAYAGILPKAYLDALSLERRTDYWRKLLEQPRSGTFVCESHGSVIGWVDQGLSRDADRMGEAEVYALYVAPGLWRQGTGERLMDAVERDVFARGIARISLWVLESNRVGRGFYVRAGFSEDGARKTIQIGGQSFSELRYEKNAPTR